MDDDALWYRVKVISFPRVSLIGRPQASAADEASGQLEGVLAWAVEGAIKWFALGSHGLGPKTPDAVTATTRQHRADLDMCSPGWMNAGRPGALVVQREACTVPIAYGVPTTALKLKKIRAFILALKAEEIYRGHTEMESTARRNAALWAQNRYLLEQIHKMEQIILGLSRERLVREFVGFIFYLWMCSIYITRRSKRICLLSRHG